MRSSPRAVAADLVEVMRRLGHERFCIAGHDRGAYVALRAALDHPDVVSSLVVMDGIPISEALARCDDRFAAAWWHWFFFAVPDKPERAILADPEAWYQPDRQLMGGDNCDELLSAISDAATVIAMLEDYRAGFTRDRADEEADAAAGRRVACPTLFLWAEYDDMGSLYGDPHAIWRRWAPDVRGRAIASGHHMAEEAPEQVADALKRFLVPQPRAGP